MADPIERGTDGDTKRQTHRDIAEGSAHRDPDTCTESDSRTCWHNDSL